MARRQFRTQIGGEEWIVRYVHREPKVNGEECYGTCSPAEQVIRIWSGDTEHNRVDTLVHEWLHRRMPDFHEDAIELMATQLADALMAQRELEGD